MVTEAPQFIPALQEHTTHHRLRQNSELQPQTLKERLSPPEKEWLSRNVVTHILPSRLPGQSLERIDEQSAVKFILALDRLGVKGQVIYAPSDNEMLLEFAQRASYHQPEFINQTTDYSKTALQDPEEMQKVEREYLLWAHRKARRDGSAIIHDHAVGGEMIGLDTARFFRPVLKTKYGSIAPSLSANVEEEIDVFNARNNGEVDFIEPYGFNNSTGTLSPDIQAANYARTLIHHAKTATERGQSQYPYPSLT